MSLPYGGVTFDPARDEERLNEQTVRVYRAMLDEQWHSLYELETATGDPLQSISARLRDLRKAEFGGFDVQRRRRSGSDSVWEYCMQPPKSAPSAAARAARRSAYLSGLMVAAKLARDAADLPALKLSIKDELNKAITKGHLT